MSLSNHVHGVLDIVLGGQMLHCLLSLIISRLMLGCARHKASQAQGNLLGAQQLAVLARDARTNSARKLCMANSGAAVRARTSHDPERTLHQAEHARPDPEQASSQQYRLRMRQLSLDLVTTKSELLTSTSY
eukprot:4473286-Amphidinium_carterae.1